VTAKLKKRIRIICGGRETRSLSNDHFMKRQVAISNGVSRGRRDGTYFRCLELVKWLKEQAASGFRKATTERHLPNNEECPMSKDFTLPVSQDESCGLILFERTASGELSKLRCGSRFALTYHRF
jgi:hypothetical protein